MIAFSIIFASLVYCREDLNIHHQMTFSLVVYGVASLFIS